MKLFSETKDPNKKMTEKTFVQGMVISVVSILLCIVAICSMSYAWFSTNTSSGQNLLQGGSFALDITVTDSDGQRIPMTNNENGTLFCVLDAGAYTVELTMTAESTATKGYCDVKVGDRNAMQTATISPDPAIGEQVLSFELLIEEDGTGVLFTPKWGLPAFTAIRSGATVGELGETDGDESDAIAESDSESETEPEGLTETQFEFETNSDEPEETPEADSEQESEN